MARIVHPHGVDQQKIGVVLAAQPLAVHQQMAVGVAVIPVEAAVLDGQLLIVSEAIAGRQPGALVVELAHPVVGRRCGAFARGPGQMEDGVVLAQARHPVVGDAARHRRHAGQDALVERAGEGGQGGTQGRMQAALCLHHATEVAHAMGYLCCQAIHKYHYHLVLHWPLLTAC